jgi:hypothetical protein
MTLANMVPGESGEETSVDGIKYVRHIEMRKIAPPLLDGLHVVLSDLPV